MAQLMLQYTSGACSGPLQAYLRSTRALAEAQEKLQKSLSASDFLRALPHEWLFVNVRYGCADFQGKPTTSTSTTPTKEWRADGRRKEFLAFVSLDGSKWEEHDKEQRKRTHLPASEIVRQVEVAAASALMWVALIHGLAETELEALKGELGSIPGAITPGDVSKAEINEILARTSAPKKQLLPPLNEPLYRTASNRLEYLELISGKGQLVVRRGIVGEELTNEIRASQQGELGKDLARREQLAAAADGFAPWPDDQWIDLEVTVSIEGFGTEQDNDRMNKMADVLRNELPKLGLGSWTGDSIGSGTFEIGVRVADESLARRVIPKILERHGLGDRVTIEEL